MTVAQLRSNPVRSAPQDALRRLPQVHKLLESDAGRGLCQRYGHRQAVEALRMQLGTLRRALLAGEPLGPDATAAALFEAVEQQLRAAPAARLQRVVNATGVVLHTNLGRAPLPVEALAAIVECARSYASLEYDAARGERGSRQAPVEPLLRRLTGAPAALVVNNCAAAVLLALTALARDGDVLVSRGELVEIGGSFRIPEVIAQSGARLVEVGTTNKTRIEDYARAIGPDTRMILRTHPSNYRIVGFTERPARTELAALARAHQLAFMEDLGSGTLVDLRRFGLPAEPTVQACVREGGGLVAFSGDKLLGGPQAGVVVGPSELVDRLRQHPLQRALRVDKLSLAALAATLQLYESGEPPESRIPVLRMLAEPQAQIARRARQLVRRLRRAAPRLDCELREGESLPGGGALPEARLPTTLVLLQSPRAGADELARRLRGATPPVIGRIVEDRLALDLRTVDARELPDLVAAAAQLEAALEA